MKELKWKHRKSNSDCSEPNQTKPTGMEVLTPYPKERNGLERKLNRYNHIMEFVRTILAFTTIGLQLIILYRLTN
jgi:hypothetical protein